MPATIRSIALYRMGQNHEASPKLQSTPRSRLLEMHHAIQIEIRSMSNTAEANIPNDIEKELPLKMQLRLPKERLSEEILLRQFSMDEFRYEIFHERKTK